MTNTTQFSDLDRIDQTADELGSLLEQAAGNDEALQQAATTVATWAAFSERGDVELCRRGLLEGRADDLTWLRYRCEQMEQDAAALRALIDHVADQ